MLLGSVSYKVLSSASSFKYVPPHPCHGEIIVFKFNEEFVFSIVFIISLGFSIIFLI